MNFGRCLVMVYIASLSSSFLAFADVKSDLIAAQKEIIRLKEENRILVDRITKPFRLNGLCMSGDYQELACQDLVNNLRAMSSDRVVFDGVCKWQENQDVNSVCFGKRMVISANARIVFPENQ